MRVSRFGHAKDRDPRVVDIPWPDLAAELTAPPRTVDLPDGVAPGDDRARPYKEATPMICPTVFDGTRSKRNAIETSSLWLDIDDVTDDQWDALCERLIDLRLEAVAYSTWKHGAYPGVRARVVIPLSRPVPAAQWPTFWASAVAHIGAPVDTACRDVSRCYFVPACPASTAAHAFAEHWRGTPLDVDALPAPTAEAPPPRRARPVTRTEVAAAAKRIRDPLLRAALDAVLRGEPWAAEGARDQTLWELAAEFPRVLPYATPESLVEVFRPSLTRMAEIDGAPTEDIVLEKLTRCYAETAAEIAQAEHAQAADLTDRLTLAWGRAEPYPDAHGPASGREWIIQHGPAWWLWVDGSYRGPFTRDEVNTATWIYLAPSPLRLVTVGPNGQSRRPIADLMSDYGQVAREVVYDLAATTTHYAAGVLTLAPTPPAPLEPAYHPGVHQWLTILAGPAADDLLAWLAYLPDLRHPCVALYLDGPPGVGKSLLASGVAQLWDRPPVTMETVLGTPFNEALLGCPLVVADEFVPRDFRAQSRTAELRAMIQDRTRPLKRKFLREATLRGAVRVLITTNNANALAGDHDLTPNDIAAIAQRILYIEAPKRAARYLETQPTAQWLRDRAIAKHALWLRDALELTPAEDAPRFLIRSEQGAFHRSLATGTDMGSAVCHWLVAWLRDPDRLTAGQPLTSSAHMLYVADGVIWFNARALVEHWDRYRTNVRPERATMRRIATTITGITGPTDRRQRDGVNYRPIHMQALIEWAEDVGAATQAEIMDALTEGERRFLVASNLPTRGQNSGTFDRN